MFRAILLGFLLALSAPARAEEAHVEIVLTGTIASYIAVAVTEDDVIMATNEEPARVGTMVAVVMVSSEARFVYAMDDKRFDE